jgi:glycogen(starch) synthase
MRILLVGPYPPPHGGISVHVLGACRRLIKAGVPCHVLNTERPAGTKGLGARVRQWTALFAKVRWHARRQWTIHVHTNGHNWKSWAVAMLCGLAGRSKGGSLLTLHSGMACDYLRRASAWRQALARFACSLYVSVICVSPEIRTAIAELGVPAARLEVLPAYLGPQDAGARIRADLALWLARHRPKFSASLFFRPEYGFEMLLAALAKLKFRYPDLGCVVMGSGEQRSQAEGQIQAEALESNVLLVGDVSHDMCLTLIAASDVFVRPTLVDGDSVSVREAFSLGVPVVASATGVRPAGTILFQTGNIADLLLKLDRAIAVPKDCNAHSLDTESRLIDLYRRIANHEKAYAAA